MSDEIYFWSPMTREMYFSNKLYFHATSAFVSSSEGYPPFFQLFEQIFLFINREFDERVLFFALSVFTLACFLPAIKDEATKIDSALFILIFMTLHLSNYVIEHSSFDKFTTFLNSIQLDQMIGLLPALSFFLIIKCNAKGEQFNGYEKFFLINILSAIMLTKKICPALAVMIITLYFGFMILKKKKIKAIDICVLIIPFLFLFFWRWSCNYYSSLDIAENIVISGNGLGKNFDRNFVTAVLNGFFSALIGSPIIYSIGIKFTYLIINIIITIGIFCVLRKHIEKKESFLGSSIYVCGFIGYATTILILYFFVFSKTEALLTASFERFMGSIVYFGLSSLAMLIFYFENKKITILYLVCLLLLTDGNFNSLFPETRYNYKKDIKLNEFIEQINAIPNENKILVVTQERFPIVEAFVFYECPNKDIKYVSVLHNEYDEDVYLNLSPKEWQDYYCDFDYMYLYYTDQIFWDEYWKEFQTEPLLNDRLYSIENNKIKIVPWIPYEDRIGS